MLQSASRLWTMGDIEVMFLYSTESSFAQSQLCMYHIVSWFSVYQAREMQIECLTSLSIYNTMKKQCVCLVLLVLTFVTISV